MNHKSTLPQPNLRADSRRLFPDWPRSQRAKWVLARLRLRASKWAYPERLLSRECVEDSAPDFLRRMPPHQYVTITPTARDQVRAGLNYVWRFVRG